MKRETRHRKIVTRRALLLAGGQVALLSALAGRMYYLQVVEADQYRMLADENRINMRLLPPPRGRILDRYGVELANNEQNYRVVLIAEKAESVEETLAALAKLILLPARERNRVVREVRRRRAFVPVTVAENLSWEEFSRVNVHSPDLPGLQPEIGESRHYPLGATLAHVVGYVGAVAEDDLDGDPVLELPGFNIGKSGVERRRENDLRGKAGVSRVEVNAVGRVIRELTRNDGLPGEDVVLTIDSELQEYVRQRLEGESAASVVLDIHTGEVLALSSEPGFDPQVFTRGLTNKAWSALTEDPRSPLMNKAISGQYPPGSTFKVMVALAGLESDVITPAHRVFCNGEMELGNNIFHCWKRRGHGELDLLNGIEQSCDVYFYDLSLRVGVDRIGEMARRFGFGSLTTIGLPGERAGSIPSRDWKLATYGVPWQQGETVVTAIGQGFVLATPLQLALMAARLANGGIAVIPKIYRRPSQSAGGEADPPPSIGVSRGSMSVVLEGMNRVSNSPRGTAYSARITSDEFALAGKTGTSQVRRITRAERETRIRKNEELPWGARDHALFVAFAPVAAPRYAISVVVEHGGSGSRVAAPIARDILLEVQGLDRRRRNRAADAGGRREG